VFQGKFQYDTAAHFTFDATKVEVSGSTVRLKDLGGATYAITNPTVTSQFRVPFTTITAFAHTASTPAGSQIKYCLRIDQVDYWYNSTSAAWEESDGTYSQANTQSEISAALTTLVADLSLSGNHWVTVKAFLHSDAGTARPTLTDVTVTATQVDGAADEIDECLISAYLTDLFGADYVHDPDFPVRLNVKNHRPFFHGNRLVRPFLKSVAFNSSGYAEISIIETESIGENLEFFITYYEGPSLKQVLLTRNQVPNQATASLSEIAVVQSDDVG
jgi:hypothetical protein